MLLNLYKKVKSSVLGKAQFQEYDIDVVPHGEENRRRRGGFILGEETSPVTDQTHRGFGDLNRDTSDDDLHYVYYVKDKKGQRYCHHNIIVKTPL